VVAFGHAERHHGRHIGAGEVRHGGGGPALGRQPSGGEHVDHVARGRCDAGVDAADQAGVPRRLDEGDLLADVPRVVIRHPERDDDVAVARPVFQDADERRLEGGHIGRRDHHREPTGMSGPSLHSFGPPRSSL